MPGRFEIYKDKKGEYRFRLKASNGENLLASEGYKSKSSAVKGTASVQRNCSDEGCFETNKTPSGKHRFNMKSRNRRIIGTSQNYDSDAGCRKGIKAIGRAAPDAKILDLTKS